MEERAVVDVEERVDVAVSELEVVVVDVEVVAG